LLISRDWFVGLVITLLFLLIAETGGFATLDLKAYNLGLKISSARDPHEDVVVVAIDDKSLQKLGAWPWSRDVLAETTQLLTRERPRVVGYTMPFDTGQYEAGLASLGELRDMLRSERKLTRSINRMLTITESTLRGDDNLADAFRSGGRIVLAMPYIATDRPAEGILPAVPEYLDRFALAGIGSSGNDSANIEREFPHITQVGELFPPIEKLVRRVGGVGVVDYTQPYYRQSLIVRYGHDYLPSFALMMVTRSKGLTANAIKSIPGTGLALDGKSLGADSSQHIYPRFYDDKNRKPPFKIYSLYDVLGGNIYPGAFRDKIVLVGPTSPRLAPPLMTPTGKAISPTIATAHTISSLLNNDVYHLPDWAGWAQRGIIVALGFYLMFVLGRFRTNSAYFLSLFLLLMLFNAHFILLSSQSTWLPMMTAVVMLIVGHLIIGTRRTVNTRLEQVRHDLSAANRQLGLSLHAQGSFDMAFEKFRACHVDDSLLGQVYNLGLDYERKRQFNKAATVFRFIQQHDAMFNDVERRVEQNEDAANTLVLRTSDTTGPGPNLISSKSGIEKPKLGRYQIDSEIGRGAMGMVYLGHDDKIGRTVAIKTVGLSDDIEPAMREQVRNRFFREAEAAGRLNHPNIVTVYDVGEEQDLAYIAMDYLKGKDLTAYCAHESLLPANQVFEIVIGIASALDYAHQQHVVHRDVKPANIIYDEEKRVARITDFGVACLTDASKTKTGTVIGSPYYMAPEQIEGKKVDGRADLFSLGVTLYQLLTGELPFKGDSIANLMYNIAHEKHPDIRVHRMDLPGSARNIIDKALQKEADQRYKSGKQMAEAMMICQRQLREMDAA